MHSFDAFNIKMYGKNKADELKRSSGKLEPLYKFNTNKLESLASTVIIK